MTAIPSEPGSVSGMPKARQGNFFEDFRLGQKLDHATPRTLTAGDVSLYIALCGPRFAVQSSDDFAKALGYPQSPIDDLLVFHTIFGKTVPDISLNAIANLGYASCRFLKLVYPGDTLSASSVVIGLREASNHNTGVVYVRTRGSNQHGELVLDYVRWVMVRKRHEASPAPPPHVPELSRLVPSEGLASHVPPLQMDQYETALTGSRFRFGDYTAGEKIDHIDGMTIEEAEHQIATRLYQNTAKTHFNAHALSKGRFSRRLIYGGHIISLARSLSYNGLENAFHIAAINGGRHAGPAFAGDTIYAWTEVLAKAEVGRQDLGALRLRLVAVKDSSAAAFPHMIGDEYDPSVILDLDLWVLIPK